VAFEPSPSFVLPAGNLGPDERPDFYAGRALAGQPWVRAPSSTDARDGLGPLYNARSCLACHVEGGRALSPDEDGPLPRGTLVRLSVPGGPEPTYGRQLQTRSVALGVQLAGIEGAEEMMARRGVPREGVAAVTWTEERFEYPDGATTLLRRPRVTIEELQYGPLEPRTQIGLRHAPALHGLGLLELIDVTALTRLADPDDDDGDGISGRLNHVLDPSTGELAVGRFGLKANQPTLRVQVAAALHGDIGITSTLFPSQPCTAAQPACAASPPGAAPGEPEIADHLLELITDFNRSIGVPLRRSPDHPVVRRGQVLFGEVGCDRCHAPRFVTGVDARYPHLSGQEIWPYSDLLLHDMGEELADGRPDGEATGSEWRTAPLWGVGLARVVHEQVGMLHDGRARTVEEAVLWHGGEATRSRARFAALPADDRHALLSFVRSL
jgi:CxxC motif-containing protein (DUF1111 family)